MAKNVVQFQKGLSEAAFQSQYGTEEQCRAALFSWRWPQGFVCPKCGGTHSVVLRTRPIHQCSTCRHQVSLIAGTIFHATKLPLTTYRPSLGPSFAWSEAWSEGLPRPTT